MDLALFIRAIILSKATRIGFLDLRLFRSNLVNVSDPLSAGKYVANSTTQLTDAACNGPSCATDHQVQGHQPSHWSYCCACVSVTLMMRGPLTLPHKTCVRLAEGSNYHHEHSTLGRCIPLRIPTLSLHRPMLYGPIRLLIGHKECGTSTKNSGGGQ